MARTVAGGEKYSGYSWPCKNGKRDRKILLEAFLPFLTIYTGGAAEILRDFAITPERPSEN